MPNGNSWKEPRNIVFAVMCLLGTGGGSFGVTQVFANDNREAVETIIERHPDIVELKLKVGVIEEKIDKNQRANDKKLDAILRAIEENGK